MTTLPDVPPIVDEDRYQSVTIVSSTPYIDLNYPVFGDAGDLDVYIDGVLQSTDSWSLASISGTEIASIPLPIEDGRIVFVTAPSTGTIEIVYRWRPRLVAQSAAAGVSRREFNYAFAAMVAGLREDRRDVNEIVNLISDFAAYAAVSPDDVGPFASRSAHDLEAKGYIYLCTNDASGAPVIYVKLSATSADWSAALSLRGGSGAAGATGSSGFKWAVGAGTVDAVTAAFTPAVAALTNGLTVIVEHTGANATTTPTLKADGTLAKTIVKGNNLPLVAGDIPGANFHGIYTFDSSLDKWTMQNPAKGIAVDAVKYAGKRQCGLFGPLSSGLPNFLPASAVGLTLTTQNITSTAPLVAAAAQGSGANGHNDRLGSATANFSWTLANNTTNYIGVTIDSAGVFTAIQPTLQPVYTMAAAPSVTLGQYTFVISTMTMYLGNGATADAVWAVFLGEAVTSGGNITTTVAYAFNGYYEYTDTAALPAAATSTSKSHNLGVGSGSGTIVGPGMMSSFALVCNTADGNYAAGDVVENISSSNGTTVLMIAPRLTRNGVAFTSGAAASPYLLNNATSGAQVLLMLANWRYRLRVWRIW